VLLARWDQDGVSGLDSLLSILVSNLALPFKDVDFMLPVVVMIGSESTGFDSEVAHEKGGCSIFLSDQPPYSRSFRPFFRNWGICHRAHVHFVQCRSQCVKTRRKINGTLWPTLSLIFSMTRTPPSTNTMLRSDHSTLGDLGLQELRKKWNWCRGRDLNPRFGLRFVVRRSQPGLQLHP
jgi:hypothetical protein